MGFHARLHIGFGIRELDDEKLTQALFPEHIDPSLRELDFDGSGEAWDEVFIRLRSLSPALKNLERVFLVDDTEFVSLRSTDPWKQSSFQIDDYKNELDLLVRKASKLGITLDKQPSIGIYWYKG